MVTFKEYECAVDYVQKYNQNRDAKACMDEAEQTSFEKALDIIKEYKAQQNSAKKKPEKTK